MLKEALSTCGADAEPSATMESMRAAHEDGYLFGRCYSVIEPDGELGGMHRASVWPIDAETFADAQAHGWDVKWMDPVAVIVLNAAYQALRRHKLGEQ